MAMERILARKPHGRALHQAGNNVLACTRFSPVCGLLRPRPFRLRRGLIAFTLPAGECHVGYAEFDEHVLQSHVFVALGDLFDLHGYSPCLRHLLCSH